MHPQSNSPAIPTFANGIPHYVVDEAGCWLWQGRLRIDGHGGVDVAGKTMLAHRYYDTLHVGPIPAGRHLHHTCHVAWCVNPAHMQVITPEQHGIYRHPGQLGQPAAAPPPRPVLSVAQQRTLAEQRFWSHVEKTDGCWLYVGAPSQPKPQFLLNGRNVRASRLAHEWSVGPIPAGLLVCHHCDNPRCVRPDHLWLGTAADNHADRNRKGRQAWGERNGARMHPERLARGERNGSHTKPQCVPRGTEHYAHRHPESRQGERNPRAILREEQVVSIYERDAAGSTTVAALAREFGVSWNTVKYIVSGRHWPHLLRARGLLIS